MEAKLNTETIKTINRLLKSELTKCEDKVLQAIKYGPDNIVETCAKDYRKANSAYENFEEWWDEYTQENGDGD